MKEWIIAGSLHFVLGVFVGWVVFKRPQWATDLLAKIKTKIGLN